MKRSIFFFVFLHVCLAGPMAQAGTITYEQALSALDAAYDLQQKQLRLWRGEDRALRACLAKRPPGPGWASCGWSASLASGDTDRLRLLLWAARDFGLIGRKDMASRLILFNIAVRYEKTADSVDAWKRTVGEYLKNCKEMPEYARYMELALARWSSDQAAWRYAAAYLRQACKAEELPEDAWTQSMTEMAPKMKSYKRKVENLHLEANRMAKAFGGRITSNWPGKLDYLLDDVRTRADLGSMALVSDISEATSKEALVTLGWLFKMHDDGHHRARDLFSEEPVNGPRWSAPEKRFARKALRELDPFGAVDLGKLIPVVNKAEELLEGR